MQPITRLQRTLPINPIPRDSNNALNYFDSSRVCRVWLGKSSRLLDPKPYADLMPPRIFQCPSSSVAPSLSPASAAMPSSEWVWLVVMKTALHATLCHFAISCHYVYYCLPPGRETRTQSLQAVQAKLRHLNGKALRARFASKPYTPNPQSWSQTGTQQMANASLKWAGGWPRETQKQEVIHDFVPFLDPPTTL